MASDTRPLGGFALGRVRTALGVGFPPVRRGAFWAVQSLVFVIAGTHTLFEVATDIHLPAPLYLLPTSLFFAPVVYAALRFGTRGSVTTAMWSITLTLPNIALLHDGYERVGILWQFSLMLALAVFVGARVDLERQANMEKVNRERELRASELRYRALFDNAAEAVLVVDGLGSVEDVNEAAVRMFARPADMLVGQRLEQVTGTAIAEAVAVTGARHAPLALPGGDGAAERWIEPVVSGPLAGPDGRRRVQIMLHDVTLQQERQRGLERYARRTVTAREEERRRIGRELHDGPLQALMLVGRKLDLITRETTAPDGTRPEIEAREILDGTADELRRISRALRPSILDDLGLVPALRSEVSAFGRRSGIAALFSAPFRIQASPDVELVLLRVTQEALNNAERHASAGRVRVRLMDRGATIDLVIRDDGRGLGQLASAAGLLAAGRLGVVGMEERTRLVGGDFTLRSAKPHGTIVCVTVPKMSAANPA